MLPGTVAGAAGEEEGGQVPLSGSEESREQSVFHLTETEKYILKQIMNMTHDRAGLQVGVLRILGFDFFLLDHFETLVDCGEFVTS